MARQGPRPGRLLPAEITGSGPPVVLLHGVAFGPEFYDRVAQLLSVTNHVIVPHRPGYGRSVSVRPAPSFDEQVADVVMTIESMIERPAIVAGVSGGATLALALLLSRPDLVRHAVVHEPAIGSAAPALADVLSQAAVALATCPSPAGPALSLAQGLAGEATWKRIPVAAQRVRSVAATMAVEVPQFAAFALKDDDFVRLRTEQLVTTVGKRSGPERHEVASVLADRAGACVVTVPSRHLAQIEAPEAFASAVLSGRVRR